MAHLALIISALSVVFFVNLMLTGRLHLNYFGHGNRLEPLID